ncbi:MAG: hypothetical protein A3A97_01805 [Candidatus Terrybacteria bacterium RIFCSPLOWO2_01_FULL_40_23]|uniref:Uncharacterized protein n=1 Tax=Candidatus Terrybacteria bacterium RIFCSPLOWO2_01_FULL_40_23 TaxID=1802366 RepID=A0A1G2PWF0_9BACT|nr:MAG: hypothetical protein A3A97_01805 [Candidatus Terrybacteria bacterium RIFCSPLOWO2_01_FULL_40_23]
MKTRLGACKEYRKRVPGDSGTARELWEAVLIISIEDHPIYGHAEYFLKIGHPHGYSWEGLSDRIAEYIRIPTPSDRNWIPGRAFDPRKNGFPEDAIKTYKVNIRWQPKVANKIG